MCKCDSLPQIERRMITDLHIHCARCDRILYSDFLLMGGSPYCDRCFEEII